MHTWVKVKVNEINKKQRAREKLWKCKIQLATNNTISFFNLKHLGNKVSTAYTKALFS